MTKLANINVSSGDQNQLPLSFDVVRMQEEIQAMNLNKFIYYDVLSLRSPAHMVDSSLPLPPPAEGYADGSWTQWLDTSLLKKSPYLSSVVGSFRQHSKVTLVRLLRLAPEAIIKEHTDPTLGLQVPKSVIRLTIPILTNDAVEFFLNDNLVPMKPGECWYLRLTDPHRVINGGTTERINMTIDIVPNNWVRSLILGVYE